MRGHDGAWDTTTQTVVVGLTANTEYTFRVRARNVQGWSLTWSEEFTFITAVVPDKPAAVVTSLVNLRVRITWVHPFDNYQDITAYKILIANSD